MPSPEGAILIPHSHSFFPYNPAHLTSAISIFLNAIIFLSQYCIPCKVLGESHLLGRGKIPYSVNKFAFSRIPHNILGQIPDPKTPFQTFFVLVTILILSQILSTYSVKRKCPGFSLKNSYLDIVALVRVYGLSDLAIMESWGSVEIQQYDFSLLLDKDENIPTGEEVTDAQEDESLFEESKKSGYSKSEVDTLKLIKSAKLDEKPQIIHGEPFTDRKSTFQAHLAHVVTQDQVRQVLEELKQNRKINNATHNVMAYRIFIDDRNSYLHDCDDDGEAMAGSRLLHLLQILDVKNIIVIVTRWYGGILLGPDRFKHYNNCARDIMKVAGLVESSSDLKDSKSKGRFKVCKKH